MRLSKYVYIYQGIKVKQGPFLVIFNKFNVYMKDKN